MSLQTPNGITVDDISEIIGDGTPLGKALTSSLYGFNDPLKKAPIPRPTAGANNIFFVRPQLNLRTFNIANDRLLGFLTDRDPMSVGRAVRCTLDPLLENPYEHDTLVDLHRQYNEVVRSPLINNKLAFIPILSNTLKSLDGWIDLTMGTQVTTPDRFKGAVTQIDDVDTINAPASFSATFDVIESDINRLLLNIMYRWQSKLYQGHVVRYPHLELGKIRDYNSRIWSILTGSDGESITNWSTTGPIIVTNVNTSSIHNFKENTPVSKDMAEFSAEFSAFGMAYNEVIDLAEFNMAQSYFHQAMSDGNSIKRNMIIPKRKEAYLFKNKSYPFVDLKQMKLLWLVDKDYYNHKIGTLKMKGLYDSIVMK